jgi:N utilization substance protein A
MNAEFVRYIDSIHREKGIDTEDLFLAFEEALITTIRKKHDVDDDFTLTFDRATGEVQSEYEIDFEELGRIFAQTVKQTFYTKIKEAERDVLFNEYWEDVDTIITGQIQRFEGDNVVVSLGKVDGVIPRAEKVRGENYHAGERIRALIRDVKKVGLRVKIILSRASTEFVRRLFEVEVPEIGDGVIEIKKLEREPGYRTKIAVSSSDARVDCVGACVGVRGTRIKAIIEELNGERIDIIRWSEDPETMLRNALQPAEVVQVTLDGDSHRALVLVEEDQLSLAIGRKGQNVRLASKLTGWDIDIMTRKELEETLVRDAQDEVSQDVYTQLAPVLEEADSMFEVRFCVTMNDRVALIVEYGLGDEDPSEDDIKDFEQTLAGIPGLQERQHVWFAERSVNGKRDDQLNMRRVLRLPEEITLRIQSAQRDKRRPVTLEGDEAAIASWREGLSDELPLLRELLLKWELDLQLPQPVANEAEASEAASGEAPADEPSGEAADEPSGEAPADEPSGEAPADEPSGEPENDTSAADPVPAEAETPATSGEKSEEAERPADTPAEDRSADAAPSEGEVSTVTGDDEDGNKPSA